MKDIKTKIGWKYGAFKRKHCRHNYVVTEWEITQTGYGVENQYQKAIRVKCFKCGYTREDKYGI